MLAAALLSIAAAATIGRSTARWAADSERGDTQKQGAMIL